MGKKKTRICICLGIVFLLNAHLLTAQDDFEGDLGITAGVGFSLIGSIFDVVTNTTGVAGNSSPVLNIMVDYSFSDLVSLGAAFSYQSYEIAFDDASGDYIDNIRCLNFGGRVLFHVLRTEDLDLYGGVRASYTNWAANSTNTVAGYDPLDPFTLNSFGLQPLIGVNAMLDPTIGLNLELAPAGVYYAAIGLHIRLSADALAMR